MTYLWLKYIHILSATILFGTGLGTAAVMFYGHISKNIEGMALINNYVVRFDALFTGTTGFIQFATGIWMMKIAGYPLSALWIWGGILGYSITAFCWFVVVYLQIKIRNITSHAAENDLPLPPEYFALFKRWFWLGWPAFISLMIVLYFMVFKPY